MDLQHRKKNRKMVERFTRKTRTLFIYYDPYNEVDREMMSYIYIPVIQREASTFVDNWNLHRIIGLIFSGPKLCENIELAFGQVRMALSHLGTDNIPCFACNSVTLYFIEQCMQWARKHKHNPFSTIFFFIYSLRLFP